MLEEAASSMQQESMVSSLEEAQLLGMLIKLTGAKTTIELGVFTPLARGHSPGPPDDGTVLAIDANRSNYDRVGRQFVEKAGVAYKVDFRVGAMLELLADGDNLGRFELAFVDADKPNPNDARYHEQLLQLVRVGGVIVYVTTLRRSSTRRVNRR